MGRAVTSGQIAKCHTEKRFKMKNGAYKMKGVEDGDEHIPVPSYIKRKVKIMNQLGYKISADFFIGCVNEIQVDNRARDIIFG